MIWFLNCDWDVFLVVLYEIDLFNIILKVVVCNYKKWVVWNGGVVVMLFNLRFFKGMGWEEYFDLIMKFFLVFVFIDDDFEVV